jgi:hypothetical protein
MLSQEKRNTDRIFQNLFILYISFTIIVVVPSVVINDVGFIGKIIVFVFDMSIILL